MDPYQTAQTRINQLVGVKPTTSKNTFKNIAVKTINRIYNNSKEAQTAIFNDTYKYSEVSKRADFIKDNVQHITHINGESIIVNDICSIEVRNNNISYYIKKDSITNTLLVKPIAIIDITLNF